MDAEAVTQTFAPSLTPEEREVGVVATCWAAALALVVAFAARMAAPNECTSFMTVEFFACGRYAVIAAVGELVAAAGAAALILVAPRPTGRLDVAITWIAFAAAIEAALLSPVRLIAGAEVLSRLTAAGWLVIGVWMARSRRRVTPEHSGLALFLGVTAAVWGLAIVLDEAPRPLPIGGGLFAIAFTWWAIELTRSRTASGIERRATESGLLADITWALSRILLVFLIWPVWLSATFGVAAIGDPAISFQVVNTTQQRIDVYVSDPGRNYPVHVDAAGAASSSILTRSDYSFVANTQGVDIYCVTYRESELRRLHYIVTIRNDPSTCP